MDCRCRGSEEARKYKDIVRNKTSTMAKLSTVGFRRTMHINVASRSAASHADGRTDLRDAIAEA